MFVTKDLHGRQRDLGLIQLAARNLTQRFGRTDYTFDLIAHFHPVGGDQNAMPLVGRAVQEQRYWNPVQAGAEVKHRFVGFNALHLAAQDITGAKLFGLHRELGKKVGHTVKIARHALQ